MDKSTFVEAEYYVSGTEARTSGSRVLKKKITCTETVSSPKTSSRGSSRNHSVNQTNKLLSTFSRRTSGRTQVPPRSCCASEPQKGRAFPPGLLFWRSVLLLKPVRYTNLTGTVAVAHKTEFHFTSREQIVFNLVICTDRQRYPEVHR